METKHNAFNVTIDGENVTKHVPYPIKWQKLLDEQLDITRISMKRLPQKIIHPLTTATIKMTDKVGNELKLNTVITTDQVTELPLGSGTYDHEIYMLEETKILEGITVDALTFTNDLGRNYIKSAIPIKVEQNTVSVDNSFQYINQDILSEISITLTPKEVNKIFTFPSLAQIFYPYKTHPITTSKSIMLWRQEAMVIKLNGNEIYNYTNKKTNTPYGDGKNINEDTYALVLEEGIYDITYKINFYYQGAAFDEFYSEVNFSFTAATNHDPLPRWNIASVIERVLDLAEPHLQGVEPRFTLNAAQKAEFANIEAPEFAFTNSTLREILNQIGGYIHGMPRLIGNEIYFDMYGGTKQAKLYTENVPYTSNIYTQDIENYCTSLDSTVDNMVCLSDPKQGSITDPYYNGYKSVRAESAYIRVEEDNMFISTQYPIQEIRSLTCYYNGETAVMTPYVFESAEYNRQSSYSSAYPYSKSYALYYTQGEKNIKGLNFKVPDVTGGVAANYAIVNIYNEVTGSKVTKLNYQQLSFQVEYIPVFSARVQQTKQYIGEYKQPRTLFYNQGANLVETRYYGENMKGAVARMGNVDRTVSYNLSDFRYIPEPGEMFGDDYYIASVTCELFPDYFKCELELSQDFNRLSQYIGINSVRRFYEVSEKQAYQRDIKYADYVVIGDEVEQDETLASIDSIMKSITQAGNSHSVSFMVAQGKSESGNLETKISLPVVSTAQGNAMIFTANYEDNYSAGNQVRQDSSGAVSGYFTNAVAYADYYGRIDLLDFKMYSSKSADSSLNYVLPEWATRNETGVIAFETGENSLVVRKDGAEILSVNYVLEFVTNRRNYIIGSALARNCPLVRGTDSNRVAALYVLPNRLGKFAARVDLSGAIKITDYAGGNGITISGKSAKLSDFTPAVSGLSWAIVDQSSGELLIGSNEVITAGQAVNMPYMTLRHDVFNITKNK